MKYFLKIVEHNNEFEVQLIRDNTICASFPCENQLAVNHFIRGFRFGVEQAVSQAQNLSCLQIIK